MVQNEKVPISSTTWTMGYRRRAQPPGYPWVSHINTQSQIVSFVHVLASSQLYIEQQPQSSSPGSIPSLL